MMSRGVLFQLLAALAFGPSFGMAATQWTFCVASQGETKNVWITQVFPASERREVLESELEAVLKREQLSHFVAQCPLPSPDKVSVVNAQTTAIEFNRKLGAVMHELREEEFPSRQ
jgi:hypothetical protein